MFVIYAIEKNAILCYNKDIRGVNMSKFHEELKEPKSDYGVSLRKLLKMFNKNFYKTIQDQETFLQYLTEISNAVCRKYGVRNSYVGIDEMERLTFGENREYGIFLNESLINAFPKFAKEKNLYYAFQCIDTVIHETRHYLQYMIKDSKYLHIDPLVKKFVTYKLVMPDEARKCISYGTNPLEIDARYYAFQTLKEAGGMFDRYLFHPMRLGLEIDNSKERTSIAKSLNKTLDSREELTHGETCIVDQFAEEYSSFLEDIGLTREDFSVTKATEEQRKDAEKLNTDEKFRRSVGEIAWRVKEGKIKSVEELEKWLDSVKEKFAVSDGVVDLYRDNLEVWMHENDERDALYKRLAPEYSILFRKRNFARRRKGIQEAKNIREENKIFDEVLQFGKIYQDVYNADQENKNGMQ